MVKEEMDKILAETRGDRAERDKEIPGVAVSMDELEALFNGGGAPSDQPPPPPPVQRPKQITVVLGRAKWDKQHLADFMAGKAMELDSLVGAAVEVLEDGHLAAMGEICRINGHNAVKRSLGED